MKPKPVILVRSGLASGDVESVYACLLWFKQLIRTEPFRCPYAMHLAHRFRLAWVPVVAPWGSREGFRRTSLPPACPMSIESEDAAITTVIDVVSRPTNAARVVMASDSQEHRRYRAWLPRLMAAFKPGGYFLPAVADGEGFTDRDSIAWRRVRHEVRVEVDPAEFDSDFHRRIVSDGGKVLRIEVPGCDADFVAHSIQRTDLTATMLEQVIGLQTGLIAVNRSATTVNFDAFPPVPTGETLIVDESDPMLQSAMQAG